MFKKVVSWIVVSSENPSNVSLTLRGVLIASIPVVLNFAGIFIQIFGLHFQITSPQLTDIFNNVTNLVNISLVLVGTGISGYGALRKVINSIYDLVHPVA
jgi:hypothetical protein